MGGVASYGRGFSHGSMPVLDTCTEVTAKLLQYQGRGGKFKFLTELHRFCSINLSEAHNATADVEATTRCFWSYSKRVFYKEELDDLLFSRFSGKEPKKFNSS
jgi:DNA polymerase-3 subunit alpha